MTINGIVFSLLAAALILGVLAVIIDRLNFPQKPFTPRRVRPTDYGPDRDRTGAHIRDVYLEAVPETDGQPTAEEPRP